MKYVVSLLLVALFVCCGGDSELVEELEEIRTLSNSDPVRALSAYDTLCHCIPIPTNGYARMKYDLLGVRVQDKNDIVPQGDSRRKS